MARSLLESEFPTHTVRAARIRASRHAKPWTLGPLQFGYLAALADVLAILVAALASTFLRMGAFGGARNSLQTGFDVGLMAAVLVTLAELHKGGYTPARYCEASGQFSRALPLWNLTALATLALGVAWRAVGDYPRGGLALFYVLGLASLVLARLTVVRVLARMHAKGVVSGRRVAVLGFEDEMESLRLADDLGAQDAEMVCRFALRESESFFLEDLKLAVAAIRLHRPDDVFVALPWSRPELLENSLAALAKLPIAVHLGLGGPLRSLERAEVARVGSLSGLTLTHRPLGTLQRGEKRAFDLIVAALALVALAPLFAIVAALIKFNSPGPVLFRQKRYGLNQEPFRIFKFRTMRTMDDGAVVKQATRDDARVTGIGAYLRRFSIDELPQLLNVLIGDMSIVGPRPHALAHDQLYVEKLARYARRHNVKPGITGWAQVNGHRGEIAHDSAMAARLDHDLEYVDNWSLWLDVKIMFMTVFSRHAHSNAY